jgi:hypothetical protein
MTSHDQQSESDALRAKLNRETSRMPWQDLLRYFAGGSVIAVSDELDLVDVAIRFTQDDKAAVAQWLAEKRLGQVTDDQAKQWLEADAALWTVVVRPWVLVQLNKTV